MSTEPVLFDTPGPRARRNALLWSLVATVGVGFVLYLAGKRLADNGQFDSELWAPLFDPSHEDFNAVWRIIRYEIIGQVEQHAGL